MSKGAFLNTDIFNFSPGTKTTGELDVPGIDWKLPYTAVSGCRPGKTVLVTAGIHNAEYVGIRAAMRLAQSLSPDEITGQVVILPLVNRSGFEHRTMSAVYEDGKNLNRLFPGDPDGTASDRLSWFISQTLFPGADYYVDLHCGDGFEKLSEYVYCQGAAEPEVCADSERMAAATDMPYTVRSTIGSGGAFNHAGKMGVPAVLIERGSQGLWTEEEAQKSEEDVRRILKTLGILQGKAPEPRPHTILTHAHYIDAGQSGCWYPERHPGDIVEKGELLGTLRDYFGSVLETHEAQARAVILFQACSLSTPEGTPLIAYAEWENRERK